MTGRIAGTSVDRLKLHTAERAALWTTLGAASEEYLGDIDELPASTSVSAVQVEMALDASDFDTPTWPDAALGKVMDALRAVQPQVRHLFRGRPVPGRTDETHLDLVAQDVNSSGKAKIFGVRIGGRRALRVSITNYATTSDDIAVQVGLLDATHPKP